MRITEDIIHNIVKPIAHNQLTLAQHDKEHMGVYLSVPFCRSKCTYCNFSSGVFVQAQRAAYVDRVIDELRGASEAAQRLGAELPRAVDTIYFGGGTPSLLGPEEVDRLFAALRAEFDLQADAEITVEAAPGTLSEGTLEALRRGGCNRISLGVQSFVEQETRLSGRRYTRAEIAEDLARLRQAGINNMTLDLIAGLPGQTLASWEDSLAALVASEVPHASVYMLEVDEDSRLGREMLAGGSRYHAAEAPAEEAVAEMYQQAIARLQGAGLAQYEISNFARPGWESRHNLRYWQRRPYLGLGLDASSMLCARPDGEHGGAVLRMSTTDEMDAYLEGSAPGEVEWLNTARQHEEAWFLGLRTNAGVDLGALEAEFGPGLVESARQRLPALIKSGLIEMAEHQVRLTSQGRLLANEVFQEFLGVESL